jgi:hypothetical protein
MFVTPEFLLILSDFARRAPGAVSPSLVKSALLLIAFFSPARRKASP